MSSSGRTNRINNAAFIQNRQTMPVKTHLGALYAGRVTQFGSFYAIGMHALGSWGQYVCLFVCDVNAIFILCRLCMKQRKTLFDLFQSAIRMKHSRQHLHIDRVTEVTAVFENEKEEEEQKKQHTQLSDYNLSFFFLWKMSFIVFPLCAILQRNNYLPTILQTTLFGLFCKIHFFSPSLSLSVSLAPVCACVIVGESFWKGIMVILSISNCSEDIVHLQAHFCVSVCVCCFLCFHSEEIYFCFRFFLYCCCCYCCYESFVGCFVIKNWVNRRERQFSLGLTYKR